MKFETLLENIEKAEEEYCGGEKMEKEARERKEKALEQKRQGIGGLLDKARWCRLDFQFELAKKCYEAAVTWATTEGMVCAPETGHAIAAVIDEAVKAREEGKEKVILFCYSGHGLLDLSGYDKFLSGELTDYELPHDDLRQSLQDIENLPKPERERLIQKA